MEPAKLKDYISEQGNKRERVTVNRLVAARGGLLGGRFTRPLGWGLPFSWLGLRIPHRRLLRGYDCPPKRFKGDVDVLGGPLEPASPEEYERCRAILLEESKRVDATLPEEYREEEVSEPAPYYVSMLLVESGKIKWPPDLSHVAAAEVKAARYDRTGDLKHRESEYSGRDQAEELCRMGFDRVALMKFVVTEPVDSGDLNPWAVASHRSSRAMDEYLSHPDPRKQGVYCEPGDPYGTLLISSGAVLGKLEDMAGDMTGQWLRQPPPNRYREQATELRAVIEENLREVMSRRPVPTSVPVLVLACSDDGCGNVYVAGLPDPDQPCPACGNPPY